MSRVQSLKLYGKQGGFSWRLETEIFGDLEKKKKNDEATKRGSDEETERRRDG